MVAWQHIQTAAVMLGPWLVPKATAFYRSVRNRPPAQIRPLPRRTSYALGVLFLSAVVALLSTLPLFAPENVFQLTSSRLMTNGGVLMTRLGRLRDLTDDDHKLRDLLDMGSMDARLLYARLGPRVLLDCPFAAPNKIDAGSDYFYYAIPSLLAPHILHLFALGIATSATLCGKAGSRWRWSAIGAATTLAAIELTYISRYEDKWNLASTRASDDDFPFWKVLVWRGLAIAAVDGALGWMIWLQATGRAFVRAVTPGERVGGSLGRLERVLGKAKGLATVRNGSARDERMREIREGYWVKEGEVMESIFQEREVVDAQRRAYGNMDVVRVERDAETYVQTLLGGVRAARV